MLPSSELACTSSDITTVAAAATQPEQVTEQQLQQGESTTTAAALEDAALVVLDDKVDDNNVTQEVAKEREESGGHEEAAANSCVVPSECSDGGAAGELDVVGVKVGEGQGGQEGQEQLNTVQLVDDTDSKALDESGPQTRRADGDDEKTAGGEGQPETELKESPLDLLVPAEQPELMQKKNEASGGDEIVRATFVDFVDEQQPQGLGVASSEGTREDEGEEGQGMLIMMGNPELQKIREEQVRKWLIFEQENPLNSSSSLNMESMEVDSLAAPGGTAVTAAAPGRSNSDGGTDSSSNEHDEVDDEEEGQDDDGGDGMPRRVRFLTDQEGNLLISVFMSNTPTATTPLAESILSNGDEGLLAANSNEGQQSPSLVVSPPSLDHVEKEESGPEVVPPEDEEELVDSIEPSAPPIDTTEEEQEQGSEEEEEEEEEDEPPSIVLIAPTHPKEPPREKPPPAPSSSGDDSANESSDDTLSVSSCNSMIEILPQSNSSEPPRLTLSVEEEERKVAVEVEQRSRNKSETCELPSFEQRKVETEVVKEPVATPCFQLGGAMATIQAPPTPTAQDSIGEENNDEEATSSNSPQPTSLIIHELEEHDEGMAGRNMEANLPVVKLPNIDENNNVVNDSVLEEDEEEDDDVYEEAMEGEVAVTSSNNNAAPQFNPEIRREHVLMPELRRSTSSSSGEVEEDVSSPGKQQQGEENQQPRAQLKPAVLLPSSPGGGDEDDESQMVSLCIQEEHISSVAITIKKWEMMSKAQSTENLSNAGVASGPQVISSGPSTHHAPVIKSTSSPCPRTSSGGLLSPTPQQQAPQQPPPKPPMKPIQPVAPVNHHHQTSQSPVNRLVIHGTNSPVSNEPLVVTKAAGWSCWGNKVISSKEGLGPLPHGNGSNGGTSLPAQQLESGERANGSDEIIYAQPNPQAGSTMTSLVNPSNILKRYPKPLSKGEIVNWLREGEIHRAGLLLNYAQSHHHSPVSSHHANHMMSPVLVSWFFGLISRQQAERYLQGQPSGTFLVRISTRIWGYTLSYQAANGRTKHFLISAINPAVPATLDIGPPDAALPPVSCKQQRMSPFLPQGRYAFIGTNMTPYGTLVSLIRHHSHAPITKLGGEKLMNPCPGGPQVAGLEGLFQKSAAVSTSTTGPSSSSASSSSNLMMSSA